MDNNASSLGGSVGLFRYFGNLIGGIFKYLSSYDPSDDRMSLRNLYNSGRIDEVKYYRCREQARNDSYDPEEFENPM